MRVPGHKGKADGGAHSAHFSQFSSEDGLKCKKEQKNCPFFSFLIVPVVYAEASS
jgi:hypothetical protein